ncbi:acyl carrier protein [Kutzneria kofuensis]|uniref:Acyl carrier protein n=1 Tax=Kutzneria kofuensis TaxID=103725 RepID=A0A7W9KQ89_9PSEU|nr:phosphopantetheine-binding protein [Kutzneria kofuensis]MBB5896760.1 acyl carrier protein [Kutzneria kofuensis]
MNSIEDFVTLIRDETGLALTVDDVRRSLDDVPGWDSVHLLTLLVALEKSTGRRISVPAVLEADTLAGIYAAAVPA